MKPSREVLRASDIALEDFFTYKDFGNPFPGGFDQQPAEWVEAVMCVKAAYDEVKHKVEKEIHEDQEKEMKAKAKNKRAKRR